MKIKEIVGEYNPKLRVVNYQKNLNLQKHQHSLNRSILIQMISKRAALIASYPVLPPNISIRSILFMRGPEVRNLAQLPLLQLPIHHCSPIK